ncbi:MAG: hypothetical protein V4611_04210 [Patescibacteria group bacterium]
MSAGISPELVEESTYPLPSLDVIDYLTQRAEMDSFLMVEFGHDAHPVAHQQSRPFTGDRAYIGFEAWLRDPEGKKKDAIQKTSEVYSDSNHNIHFQTLALGGIVRSITEDGEQQKWYEGLYDPTTALPDGTAEEVLLGNVLSDPYLVYSHERTGAMIDEAVRILADSGVIVIRETIRPDRVGAAFEASIAARDLKVLARVTPEDEQWEALESQFVADPYYAPDSYYLLLSK